MATIQHRNNSYRVRVKQAGTSTLSKTFKTRAEALQWAKYIEAQLTLNLHVKNLPKTEVRRSFSEAAQAYIAGHSIHKKIVRSETYRLHILMKRWEGLSLQEVDKKAVICLRDELVSSGRANDTVNHYFNTISKLFQMVAAEWDMEIPNPIKGLKRMTPAKGRTKRLNPTMESLFITACNTLNYFLLRAIIGFAIQTGMRRGEIMALTWADINLQEQKAYLHTSKNGRPRQVPLSKHAVQILSTLSKDSSGKVFPMTLGCLRTQFERARSLAKDMWLEAGANPFESLRFHDLRHEALSRLSDGGLNTIELSCISGHKTLAMLARYTHPSHEAILRKLENMYSP